MARAAVRLTVAKAKALVAAGQGGRHADGGGLYLHVTGPGRGQWAFRFMRQGVHDVSVVVPIFHRARLVGFGAITSHMPDIGGRLRSSGVREIYEEGLQIPMLKLVSAGETDQAVVAFIRTNVRVPEATMGDIWGEVAACHKVAERLGELLDETGMDIDAASAEIRARSEAAMRAAIRAMPDGAYRYTLLHDGFEERITIASNVHVEGDAIRIDYTGTSAQLPRAVNVVPIYTFAYTAYGVKAVLCPEVPNNEGSFLPVTTSAPEGSILNPRYPAGGARGMIGHLLPVAFMGAMGEVLADKVWAPGSGNSPMAISGEHAGRRYGGVFFFNAGQGASSRRDGLHALSFPSNLSNAPIEVMEDSTPMRVLQPPAPRQRRGGAGLRKGGEGLEFAFEFVGDTPAIYSFIVTHRRVAPPGLAGGKAGLPGRLSMNETEVDPAEHIVLKPGDRVTLETAGGGGWWGAPA
jgi:N-methylhydantoinase B